MPFSDAIYRVSSKLGKFCHLWKFHVYVNLDFLGVLGLSGSFLGLSGGFLALSSVSSAYQGSS